MVAGLNPKILGVMALSLLMTACSTKDDSASAPTTEAPVVEESTGPVDGRPVARPDVEEFLPGSEEELESIAGRRVFFGYDQYDLTDAAQRTLRNQASWLRRYPSRTITVEGHCDERGTREYNLALGARRADAVRRYLMVLGVDGDRIRTISYGKERPEVAASNQQAWARNRRAITLVD